MINITTDPVDPLDDSSEIEDNQVNVTEKLNDEGHLTTDNGDSQVTTSTASEETPVMIHVDEAGFYEKDTLEASNSWDSEEELVTDLPGDSIELEEESVDEVAQVTEVDEADKEVIVDVSISPYSDDISGAHPKDGVMILPTDFTSDEEWDELLDECATDINGLIKKEVSEEEPELIAARKKLSDVRRAISLIYSTMFIDGEFKDIFKRKGGNFSPKVQVPDSEKRIGIKNAKYPTKDNNLKGTDVQAIVSQLINIGVPVSIPLWHTGIYVTLSPFSEPDIFNLNIQLEQQRSELGMDTKGAVFTGSDVHLVNTILEAIFNKVTKTTLKGATIDTLRSIISPMDIHTLMLGALRSMYPMGYPIIHYCIHKNANDEGKRCDYVLESIRREDGDYIPESLLDFTKILVPDRHKLSTKSKLHMADEKASYSLDDIRAYQADLNEGISERNTFTQKLPNGTEISATFKVGNLKDYRRMCTDWVVGIETIVDSAINMSGELNDRDKANSRKEYMRTQSNILDLLRHINWISKLEIKNPSSGTYTATEEKAIKDTLLPFTSIDGFKEGFEAALSAFKNDTVVSFIGIPNFICPKCKNHQIADDAINRSLIPLNMTGFFFTIIRWHSLTRQK